MPYNVIRQDLFKLLPEFRNTGGAFGYDERNIIFGCDPNKGKFRPSQPGKQITKEEIRITSSISSNFGPMFPACFAALLSLRPRPWLDDLYSDAPFLNVGNETLDSLLTRFAYYSKKLKITASRNWFKQRDWVNPKAGFWDVLQWIALFRNIILHLAHFDITVSGEYMAIGK